MQEYDPNKTYLKISRAINYITENKISQPSLLDVASSVGLSEYHLQRLFSEWVGISPKQFLMFQTKEYAKACLHRSSVLQSSLDSGLSGSGRLHDLMLSCEGITPGEYKRKGLGVDIHYGVHASPFGFCLIANTERGVCKLSFFDQAGEENCFVDELFREWPNAVIVNDKKSTGLIAEKIFKGKWKQGRSLRLLLKGSPFQLKVWQALLSIPESYLCSYQQVADSINSPKSVRAVASAIASNKLAYLIPCHRVIKNTGEFNQYRWGKGRKAAMIIKEAASKE